MSNKTVFFFTLFGHNSFQLLLILILFIFIVLIGLARVFLFSLRSKSNPKGLH